jgi:hypothetical protein
MKDLRTRKSNCVLVVKDGALVPADIRSKFEEEVDMNPSIEQYRSVYANDLERRFELNKHRLSAAFAITTLLNPVFRQRPGIVGSGMMTDTQYHNAKEMVLQAIQDILDSKDTSIIVEVSSDDNSAHPLDAMIDHVDNEHYHQAQKEFNCLKCSR